MFCDNELKPTDNPLEIEVVNGWLNRLTGDASFPDDSILSHAIVVGGLEFDGF